ncbi:zinc finger protein 653 isoform X1 [Ranitomeya imitator]|uniref:zinc finger protein 653 isoform X1 n=1 Tax=Ranitomeya imitator TaxID=111125 RepID=UPI0037E7369E
MAAPVVETPGSEEEEDDEYGRKMRGRPRLNDRDRVRRRLESRKKYDCRRVYLGEAHGAWMRRRDRGGGDSAGEAWSDARLAAHLLALESGSQGKPEGDVQVNPPQRTRQKRCVNNLLSLVTWYHDHESHCPHEPALSELDTSQLLYTTAVWQCQAGHHFSQDLRCPLKTLNHKVSDDDLSSDDSSSTPAPVIQVSEPDQPLHTLYSESMTDGEEPCTEETETVMCVPMGTEADGMFEEVTQEALGQVVAGASQVIIITGHGYHEALTAEGIQLDVSDGGSGDDSACTTLEPVSGFTQGEEQEEDGSEGAMMDENALYTLEAETEGVIIGSPVPESVSMEEPIESVILETGEYEVEQVVVKRPPRKRNRRAPVTDADGVPEMFHCPYEGCAQVYTALNSFQNHVNLIHRKGRTKVCPEEGCGKKFYLTNHLRRHMIIHTGVREFICETCGKSFKRKSHLEVHRRTHTGETPLQCEVCGFQCRQRASLNWHMRKHNSMIQYSFSCEHCGKLFEKRESVKFHKLKSHPEGRAT